MSTLAPTAENRSRCSKGQRFWVLSAVATTARRDQLLTRIFPSPRSSSARARRGVRTLEGAQGLNSPGR